MRIAIDLTPLLPGGENGGVKLLALELLKGFQRQAPQHRLLVLCASWNREELAAFAGDGVELLCVIEKEEGPSRGRRSSLPLPARLEGLLRRLYVFSRARLRERLPYRGPLARRRVDVLLCPFTAPTFAEPGIPVVSVINDLQHREYPGFFTPQELATREAFYAEVKRRADYVVCISESTRRSVLDHLGIEPGRTCTIPIAIHTRLPRVAPEDLAGRLARLGLSGRPYLFYPANFWPHKNHRMLLAAYGIYLARNPGRPVDLVFTGALEGPRRDLEESCRRLGLSGRVHFLGYLPDGDLAAVWQGCELLVFPSLYEGFGIPLLEAMQFEKPIVCSGTTSLPEVAGGAALYFDPRRPHEIAARLAEVLGDEGLAARLVRQGRERLGLFRPEEMVERYLRRLAEAASSPPPLRDELGGVSADGWTGPRLEVTHSADFAGGTLELALAAPEWLPHGAAVVRLRGANGQKGCWRIDRGGEARLSVPLGSGQGRLVFSVAPLFVPAECGLGEDRRSLGLMCLSCRLKAGSGEKVLWPAGGVGR